MASFIRFSAATVALSALALSPAVAAPAGLSVARGALNPEVDFAVASTSATEASGLVSVSVVLSAAAVQDVTIPYSVGGSATAADATVPSGPLVIPAGQLSGSIDVTVLGDSESEGLERVALTLGAPTGGVLGSNTVHEVVIADDEAPATLAFDVASSSAPEGAGSVALALTLSSARTEAVVLDYALGGTATPGGVDVSNPSASSLVIPGGSVTATIDVSLIADSLDEPDEVLTVDFVTATNASPGATTSHALTIIDDDDPPSISFSAGSAVAVEDDPMAILGVELSTASGFDVTVPITASGTATAGVDFSFAPAVLTIPAGSSSGSVDVTLLDDQDVEAPENAVFTLGSPTGASLGSIPSTSLLIIDDDGPDPTLTFATAASTVDESAGMQSLLVQLDGYAASPVRVDVTLGGTASVGVDVNLLTTSLSIPVGSLGGVVEVEVLDDAAPEASETAVVTLVNPVGAVLGAPDVHTLTITDDDTVSTVSFIAPASTVSEAVGLVSVGVSLDVAASTDVTIPLVLSGSATAGGVDAEVLPQPLVIPAGALTGQFDVTVVDDALYEGDEDLILTFGAITGADPGATVAHQLTLTDDDPLPVVQFPVFRTVVSEIAGSFNLRLELDAPSGLDVVAPFQVTGDAAGPGDISVPPGPAVIPAGATAVDIPITVVVDRIPEPGERVLFTLLDGGAPGVGAPDGATLGAGTSFLVMLADGDAVALAMAPPLTPSVPSVPFSQGRVGEPSAPQTVFFTNLHTAPVVLRELVIRGEDANCYSATSQSTLPVALAPGQSVGVDVVFSPLESGGAEAVLLARQNGQGAPPIEVALSGRALGPTGADLLITAGPNEFIEPGGQVWIPEYDYTGGSYALSSGAVSGTDLDSLYHTVRVGAQFSYSLPVPNGVYELSILSFEPVKTAPGQRVFDVEAEGIVILEDLDLYDEVGRFAAYTSPPATVVVSDGMLDLSVDASVAQALLSGLTLRSVPVLSSPTSALTYGIVDQGLESSLSFVIQNDGLHTGQLDSLTFGEPTLGSSADFRVDHAGVSYVGEAGERTYSLQPPIELPPGATDVVVTFAPTEHEDHTFDLELESTELGVTFLAGVAGTGGAEAGWGFLHPVPDSYPTYLVDYDGDGVETVQLLGEESHTHEPGRQLVSFNWRVNGAPVASTAATSYDFPLGDTTVELEIGDDNVTPNFASDDRTISVFSADAVPGALVKIYDGSVAGEVFLLDNVPSSPDFVQRLTGFTLSASGGTVGDSPYTGQAMVRWESSFELAAARTLDFQATGGVDRRLLVDGSPVSGPLALAAGAHTIEARFAVSALADMPVAVEVFEGGAVASDIEGLLNHDESLLAPVIHSMPSVGTDLGGNRIEISGFGFFPSSQVVVHWGTQDLVLADFDEYASELIVLTSPPGSGAIQVTIETPNGVSQPFPFNYSPTGPIPIRFNLLNSAAAVVSNATSAAWGPDGKLYVVSLEGAIHVITYDGDYGVVSNEFKTGVSNLTNHDSLGVVFNPYDVYDPQDPSSVKIYVAHGEHFQNGGGSFTGPSDFTGQVTVLSGPDFDNPVPLVTGLPLSNHDHGLNGMFVDDNGDILLCSGSNTNAGIKWPLSGDVPESPLSAALLRICTSRPNFNGVVQYEDSVTGALVADQVYGEQIDVVSGVDVEVFAPGLRNALDLVLHSNGYLYATDNGPNNNFGPASLSMTTQGGYPHPTTGDALYLVEPGRYYGLPNRARGRYDERQAVYRSNADPAIPHLHAAPLTPLNASSNGIDEYRATAFNSGMRGDLVAMKWNTGVWQIILNDSGRRVTTKVLHGTSSDPFTQNRGLDVVTGPGGAILAIDYNGNKVRVQVPDDAAAIGLTPYDIFPWRAPATGGQPFVIGGQNFGSNLAATSVLIGGTAATVTSVSDTRIEGLLPPSATGGATGALDVEVQIGLDSRTITGGFRYMPPAPGQKLGRWRPSKTSPLAISDAGGAEVDGDLFLFGSGASQTIAYNVFQDSYSTGGSVRPFGGGGHAVTSLDGLVYLFGGFDAAAAGKVQIYDPVLDSWSLGSAMPWDAGGCAAVVQDGLIYVGGGVAPAGATVGNFAVYDPTADSWTALAALPTAVHVPAAGSDGERIFVMGGRTGSLGPQAGIDEVQAFDPGTGIWESSSAGELEPMALPRSSTGPAVFWDGELYVFGGADASTAFGDVQVYSPQSDSWRQDCPLEDPRHGAAVVFFESRTFLLGGSSGASAGALRTGEVFSPR
jgi:hypothetical protein